MTNSYGPYLLKAADCILQDAIRVFPESKVEFERDFERLSLSLEAQGAELFTIQLPALGKHFDKCLENGLWVDTGLPFSRRRGPRSAIPRLFWGLHSRVFDDDGLLKEEPDLTAILFLRQLYAFAKKFKGDCHESRTIKTVQDFYRLEHRLPSPSLRWEEDEIDTSGIDNCDFVSYRYPSDRGSVGDQPAIAGLAPELPPRSLVGLLTVTQKVADLLACTLGVFDPLEYLPKHGPGAVSDLGSGQYKYCFPHWSERLSTVFPLDVYGFANYNLWADYVALGEGNSRFMRAEPYSKLIKVPKTHKGPRLIASEPVSHQWCQQIIWQFFDDRYKQTYLGKFVHFRDQTFNQEAARRASRDNRSWTVDLSSASDSVSLRLVERMFRRNLTVLRALHSSRTRYLHQEIDKKMPKYIELKKFSTMGSACTFPVESHVFLVLCLAATLYERGLQVTERSVRGLIGQVYVFGDDIIIPSDAGKTLHTLLAYFHFGVNRSKTYVTGRFRESCGSENFRGYDVTPGYVLREYERHKPESVASTIESSNNFFKKGFWILSDWLRRTVQRDYIIPVVGPDSGFPAFRSFCRRDAGTCDPSLKTRYSTDLQKQMVKLHLLKAKCSKTSEQGDGPYLQYFTESPSPDVNWESGAVKRPSLRIKKAWVALEALDDSRR